MSLTDLITLIILFFALVLIVIGIALYRKRNKVTKKPTLIGVSALFLQLLLILLFFSEMLVNINEMLANFLWWGVVIYGLIIGALGLRNNIPVALLTIFLCFLLIVFMMLMLFITSM